MDSKSKKKRRKVLKVLGSGAGSIALTGKSMASKDPNRKREYVGFKYNARTQEVTSDISAQLSRSENNLGGVIELGNYRLPISAVANNVEHMIEKDNPADYDERLSTFKLLKGGKYASGGRKMKLDISSVTNGDVSGLLRHSIDQPKEAFKLRLVEGKKPKSRIVREMKEEFRGE